MTKKRLKKESGNNSEERTVAFVTGGSLERKGLAASVSAVGSFLLHTSAAMIVSPIIVVLLVLSANYIFKSLSFQSKAITEIGGVANPLIWGPGFILGFVVNRATLHCAACWVWLCGIGWLAIGILGSVHNYDARFYQGCSALENVVNAFFILNSHRCGGGSSTLAGLFFTVPAMNSVAYAAGTWVAIRYMGPWMEPRKQEDQPPVD